MNGKILVGMVLAIMFLVSCVSASQVSKVDYSHSYEDYINNYKYKPMIDFFGIKFPSEPPSMSVAIVSEIKHLVQVKYVPETISDNIYYFDIDTGHVDYIYWEDTASSVDVGNDGVQEMGAVIGIVYSDNVKFITDQVTCNIMGGVRPASSCVVKSFANAANWNFYYSLSNDFTDSNGIAIAKGVYFRDEKISQWSSSQETEGLSKIWAVRRWAMNKYMDENCQNTEGSRCSIPIKFSSSGISISNAVMHYSTFAQDYKCNIGHGNQLATETFSDGKLVSMYSFRYPIHHFCPSFPVMIIDGKTGIATSNAELYFKLERGEIIEVPKATTYVFFYVVKNNNDFPFTCQSTYKYDINGETCTPSVGIAFLCSEGEWDSTDHMCYIATERQPCKLGTWDQDKKKCIWHPPDQALCDEEPRGEKIEWEAIRMDPNGYVTGYCPVGSTLELGDDPSPMNTSDDYCMWTDKRGELVRVGVVPYFPSTNAIYNVDTRKCEWTPTSYEKCEDEDAVFENGVCNFYPQAQIVPCAYTDEIPVYTNGEWLCIYKQTENQCPNGGDYNPESGYCEREHDTINICTEFPDAIWNRDTGVCEYSVTDKWMCEDYGGLYDPINDLCYVEIMNYDHLCPDYMDGEILQKSIWVPELGACVSVGSLNWSCIIGTYDGESNTCKIARDIDYEQCPPGTQRIPGSDGCHSSAEPWVDCPDGFEYSDKYQTCYIIPDIDCPGDARYDEDLGRCVGNPVYNATWCPNGWYYPEENRCEWVPHFEVNCGDYGEPYTKEDGTIVCMEIGDVEIHCKRGTAETNEAGEIVCVIHPPEEDPNIITDMWDWLIDFFKFLFFIK